ncbi:SGNH/GDSL hydrolase family protein [Microvirga sp. HBU67558]|uniref:SGNH/GDSL hydrolase family protein n=1 Tax=Microvirga TaxID=186650 RepID=UPI001B388058|nr:MULTISPECIES: SGNH/GDSL hydrolase family protein [unclassified Microvirga]MBQ0819173.1 SGNH/GDSL hydrolase family protein [Microvirga sp. HBU67558]
MEKEGLARSQTGADRRSRPPPGRVRTAAAVASFLLAGWGAPALAEDPGCHAHQPIVSIRTGVARLAARLRHHDPVRILAIGSSSTQGIGASSPAFSYPAQLEADLGRTWDHSVHVENAGKAGETISETVGRLEAALGSTEPDLVIWQVGTNDAVNGGDEVQFSALLKRGIDAARALGVDVLLVDQQYYPAITDLVRYERFVNLVGTTASAEQVPVFSRYKLMKTWSEQAPEVLVSMLSGDGFHLGDRGYDCMAQLIADSLQALAAPASASSGSTVAAAVRP